ncbi:MAG: toll/interleukin-1 receptor domain-containing protein, partial [Pseudomonadota bacterium]
MEEATARYDFFIAHAGVDSEAAAALYDQLQARGFAVFLDRECVLPGDRWDVVIPAALESSRVCVALSSAAGKESGYYQHEEGAHAIDLQREGRLRLVPVFLDDSEPWYGARRLNPLRFTGDWVPLVGCLAKLPEVAGRAAAPAPTHVRVSTRRLPWVGAELLGREGPLARLDAAWADPGTHVFSVVAPGGIGKTALVSRWIGQQARAGYPGAARVYAWSFYSQGAGEGWQASGDLFVNQAPTWFGDPDPRAGDATARAERLARLVRAEPTLLILDGLGPLQHPPGPLKGRLKDPAIAALLEELASHNRGLCLLTSRLAPEDIADCRETTAPVEALGPLTEEAGAALLRARGVLGAEEALAAASREYGGHALALYLLGGLLAAAHGGDVRARAEVGPLAAAEERGDHARRVLEAYERWLDPLDAALWRLLGLFDRPARPALIGALRQPAIPGLTDALAGLSERQWRTHVHRLEELDLLSAGADGTLDAHPLLREHLGAALREGAPAAWRAGHRRLYEALCASAEERPDDLAGMEPLLQAIAHGCQAGRHREVAEEVLWRRVLRGDRFYLTKQLGAFAAYLSALDWLFQEPWARPEPALSEPDQAFVLGQAGFALRALGRLAEARGPMEAGLAARVRQEAWKNAAIVAGNLSELHATLGQLAEAEARAREAMAHADRSGDAFQRMGMRTTLADALHQRGRWEEARALFAEAEALQAEWQPHNPLLYSLQGYRYSDLLLGAGEAGEARRRGETALVISERNRWLLDNALDHLLLGRAAQALGDRPAARTHLDQAVAGLRAAGQQDDLPRGLLARAACLRVHGDPTAAAHDLAEATRIARRGGMRLHLADAALEAA